MQDGVRPFTTSRCAATTSRLLVNGQRFVRQAPSRGDGSFNGASAPVNLYSGQAPQAFRYDVLVEAHRKAREEGIADATDDAQLVLRTGGKVGVIEGSYENFKITTYADFCSPRRSSRTSDCQRDKW
jgi:2-C-methyl-D-erythritol 4-phosphate cytidylyltransferase